MPAIESHAPVAKSSYKRDDFKSTIDSESGSSVDKSFSKQLKEELEKNREATATNETSAVKEELSKGEKLASIAVQKLPNDEALEESNSLLLGNELPLEVAEKKNAMNSSKLNTLNVTGSLPQEGVLTNVLAAPAKSEAREVANPLRGSVESEISELSTDQLVFTNKNTGIQKTEKVEIVVNEAGQAQKTIQTVVLNAVTPGETQKTQTDNLPVPTQVNAQVNSKQWGAEFSQKINVIVNSGQQQVAELRLNPAHLGPLSVRLSLDDDQASLSFLTNHHAVKEAVELSMPRLREQLQQQGLELVNVNVEQRNESESFSEDEFSQAGDGSNNESDEQEHQEHELTKTININTGVSVFV